MKNLILKSILLAMVLTIQSIAVHAQTTEFTYQGNLNNGAAPATGNYDFEFALFSAVTAGSQLGSTITVSNVAVTNGGFSTKIDFGNQFTGPSRFLEIRVRQAGGGAYTTLTPRQSVNSAPYSVKSLTADTAVTATNATQLGGVDANQYVTVTGGATSFIQNTSNQQTGNFSLSGTGSANILNATTQFNIGGNRILSAGADNIFAGFQAGQANTSGTSNSFFGVLAGGSNSSGSQNSFFGRSAGRNNNGGHANSFFGDGAGNNNSSGTGNSFFGFGSGDANGTGSNNTMVGTNANVVTNNLSNSSAFGYCARVSQSNSLVLGGISGVGCASFNTNVGIGTTAPNYRLHIVGENVRVEGNSTSIFPRFSLNFTGGVSDQKKWQNYAGLNSLSFTALNDSETAETHWLLVQRGTGTSISSILMPNGNIGIGTLTPLSRLDVRGDIFVGLTSAPSAAFINSIFIANDSGNSLNSFRLDGDSNNLYMIARSAPGAATGAGLVFRTAPAGGGETDRVVIDPNGNVGILARLTVNGGFNHFANSGNANFFMKAAGTANGINFGVAGNTGSNSTLFVSQYDGTTYQDRLILDNNGNIVMPTKVYPGGIPSIIPNNSADRLSVNGTVSFAFIAAGGILDLCWNPNSQIAQCSSSIRYKNNIQDFKSGLDLVRKLRPVTFDWKANKMPDLGLVAEEVAAVEPLLTTTNDKGEIEGVKYDRVGVVLVNAVNEQQQQIEVQQKTIENLREQVKAQQNINNAQQKVLEAQQEQINELKLTMCQFSPSASVCKQ